MKKWLLQILMALALVLCIVPMNAEAAEIVDSGFCGENGDNVKWELMDDGVLKISGRGEIRRIDLEQSAKKAIVEEGITSIGSQAFLGCHELSEVILPNSLVVIDDGAFEGCYNLSSVNIPSSVVSIGKAAFEFCHKLENIVVPISVEQIGESAFDYVSEGIWVDENNKYFSSDRYGVLFDKAQTRLIRAPRQLDGKYDVPVGVITIEASAFSFCENLTEVIVPDGVTVIGHNAFFVCRQLKKATVPDSVISIGSQAFQSCTSLEYIRIPNDVTELEYEVFKNCKGLTEVTIPASVTNVGCDAFAYCSNLVQVSIAGDVTEIGHRAFIDCRKLESINIPESVCYIGDNAFMDCVNLKRVDIRDINAWASIDFFVMYSNPLYYGAVLYIDGQPVTDVMIEDVSCIKDYVFCGYPNFSHVIIPDGITSIGKGAFYGCTNLVSISIPDSVSSIGRSAFEECSRLESVFIPEGVTIVESGTFAGCSNLVNVNIPDSVTEIRNGAFSNCISLTSIAIPNSVTTIETAFVDCTQLATITIPASVTYISNDDEFAFHGCSSLDGIWVDEDNPVFSSDDRGVLFNKDYTYLYGAPGGLSGDYEIPSGVIWVVGDSFTDCGNVTDIWIPSACETIGADAFVGCSKLQGIWVDKDNEKYYNDENGALLKRQSYPAGTSLLVAVPAGFCGSYEVVAEVNTISGYAFDGCYNLTSIHIPASVNSIGALSNCIVTEGIWVEKGSKTCSNDEHGVLYAGKTLIKAPQSLSGHYRVQGSRIAAFAFQGCEDLTSITFARDVSGIGRHSFLGCGQLHILIFEGRPPQFDTFAFRGITATAFYPSNEEVWTNPIEPARGDYGGNITWVPYDPSGTHEHSYTMTTVPPTCTEDGYDLYSCSCGDSYKENYVVATIHDFASSDGQTFICKNCGDVFSMQKTLDELQQKLKDGTLTPEDVQEVVNILIDIALEYWKNLIFGNSETAAMIAQVEDMMSTTSAVSIEGDIAQTMNAEDVSIVGAKLNSEEDVTLAISDVEGAVAIPEGYNENTAVTFSMDLEGVADSEQLDVPVLITLPVPDTLNAENVAILHYGSDNAVSEVIEPAISEDGTEASFVVTGFSNFAMVERHEHRYGNGTVCMDCGKEKHAMTRIYGDTRFETAYKVADAMKDTLGIEKFSSIIVTSGMNFADALSGSYLAAVKQAPILLSHPSNAVNDGIRDYVEKNLAGGGTVYILGGETAVPSYLDDALAALGVRAQRVAGSNRFLTNLEILNASNFSGGEILVCTALNFADSLSASATGKPILLVLSTWTELSEDYVNYLSRFGNLSFTIVGGEAAVSAELERNLSNYGSVRRVFGSNRFTTSVEVAKQFVPEADTAVLAYAMNFPDGLCGGPLAYAMGAPLILTMDSGADAAIAYTSESAITQGYVLGGPGLISDETVAAILKK